MPTRTPVCPLKVLTVFGLPPLLQECSLGATPRTAPATQPQSRAGTHERDHHPETLMKRRVWGRPSVFFMGKVGADLFVGALGLSWDKMPHLHTPCSGGVASGGVPILWVSLLQILYMEPLLCRFLLWGSLVWEFLV